MDELLKQIESEVTIQQRLWWPISYRIESCFIFSKSLLFRVRHGFWPKDWYNFDYELCKWVEPRLKYLLENSHAELPEELEYAYQLIKMYSDGGDTLDAIDGEEGMKIISKHLRKLWD